MYKDFSKHHIFALILNSHWMKISTIILYLSLNYTGLDLTLCFKQVIQNTIYSQARTKLGLISIKVVAK